MARYYAAMNNDPFLLLEHSREIAASDAEHRKVMRARAVLNGRTRRDRFCLDILAGPSPFGDPAWYMLVDLYVAQSRGQDTPISSLCMASGGPSTTALRYLRLMGNLGLITRQPSKHDRRIVHVRLTPKAEALLGHVFAD